MRRQPSAPQRFFNAQAHDRLIEAGHSNGCVVDHTEIPRLFAIDVPPSQSLDAVVAELEEGAGAGLWDYEEGNLSAQHSPGGDSHS